MIARTLQTATGPKLMLIGRIGTPHKRPTLAVVRGDAPRKVYRTVLAHPSQAADAPRVA